MKRLEAVSFVGESRAVVKLVGIEISRSLDKISVNEPSTQVGAQGKSVSEEIIQKVMENSERYGMFVKK
ncbi:MAG TPA: hypothetical protein VFW91_19120 [Candidatus Binatia bacterium]|nr:hypothetical protein [Candidatus Binatia bacterium]